MDWEEVKKREIYCCVTGSHMYGMARLDSDLDTRGVYIGHPEEVNPGTIKHPAGIDSLSIELREFVRQLKNGDHQKIEMLFSKKIMFQDPIFRPIYVMRHDFLSEAWRVKALGYLKATLMKPKAKGADWAHALRLGYIVDQVLTFKQPYDPNNILPIHARALIMRLKANKASEEDVLTARLTVEVLYSRIQNTTAPSLDTTKLRKAYYKVSSAFWSNEFASQSDSSEQVDCDTRKRTAYDDTTFLP